MTSFLTMLKELFFGKPIITQYEEMLIEEAAKNKVEDENKVTEKPRKRKSVKMAE